MGIHQKLSTTVSTKGQVILPKAIRDLLEWEPGTRLAVEATKDGVVLKREPLFSPTTVEEVYGCLKYDGPPISIKEMNAAIEREAKRRARY
jgi:AbrB family looped-hinge helix DNA binding protein